MEPLTVLLRRLRAGDRAARDAVFAAAYEELRSLARARLRAGGASRMLDTTGLVHESYLRFIGTGELRPEDRRAFFGYASQVMRSVIVDAAREQLAGKRGGGWLPVTLSTGLGSELIREEEHVIHVHEAFEVLANADAHLAALVEMRYFGGYSTAEIADALTISERTVQRDLEKGRLILAATLR